MKPHCDILSPPSCWLEEPAIMDGVSGRRVAYRELPSLLELEISRFPKSGTLATCAKPDFSHVLVVLAAIASSRSICPLNFRLPRMEMEMLASMSGANAAYCKGHWEPVKGNASKSMEPSRTLLFTSGSSGKPKGVIHRVRSHWDAAIGSAGILPLGPGCIWALNLSLHHVSGLAILFRCLSSGAGIYIPDPAKDFSKTMGSSGITHLSAVSTQLRRLLENQAPLHRLRAVLAGGGPFPDSLLEAALQAGTPLHLTYGMTETASQITTTTRLLSRPKGGFHMGKPLPDREIRIGKAGEVSVRGTGLFEGYLGSGSPLDKEGWFATGDLGEWTEDGGLRILGRQDRMFISGGENLYPERIEAALMECPGVRVAAVVARKDREFGYRPVAFLSGSAGRAEILAHLHKRLAGFEIPDAFFYWPPELSDDITKIPSQFFAGLLAEGTSGVYQLQPLE